MEHTVHLAITAVVVNVHPEAVMQHAILGNENTADSKVALGA
jgi:hypothetical protein